MTIETFFLPREVARTNWSTPADVYNLYRMLLMQNNSQPVFVPIRNMQFMAILDQQEILFVDSQSYAVSGETGGRMILLAWQFSRVSLRDSLDKPLPCEVVFYEQENRDLQQRVVVEFKQALGLVAERYRDGLLAQNELNILRL